MIDILKLSVALMVISLAAGLAIGITHSRTKERIELQGELVQKSSLESVFPEGLSIEEKQGGEGLPEIYWIGRSENGIEGFAFEISSRGYSGDINYMVGVDPEGKITGITIIEQKETPGLGARMVEVASSDYIWTFLFSSPEVSKPWFTEQFEALSATEPIGVDKSMGEWHQLHESARNDLKAKNSVTAITGSTISTTAVVRGIEQKVSSYFSTLKGNE